MAVPFIDLQRFEDGFLERWAERAAEIAANTRFVGGPDAVALEAELAERADVAEVVGCANGTDALQLALRAVGVGPGDTVVIPDATFWATFEAPVNVGARVVTVDVDPDDLQMSFDLFREAVERHRPKAAILVHLYGWGSARLDEFRAYCREHEVPLIEDGAQAIDVTWQGASIFRDAHIATVSFYPAKVLGSCGDAGAVYCSSPELATTVRQLGNHGRTGHYEHGLVGWNSRLGGFDASFLRLSLEYLDRRIASRRRAVARYREALADSTIRLVAPPAGYDENGYLAVTLHDPEARPRVEDALRARGIGFGVVYPGAMSKQPAAAEHLVDRVGGEVADRLCRGVLNPPLFAYITDDEVDEVVAALHATTG
ncbi:MAG: aminotransferase class I/II-fold pyridoxal phosphate-dependent enzyme [Acidobacteriota bacterium]